MIRNRFRLTPELRETLRKRHAIAPCSLLHPEIEEALFLIRLRLNELTLLVPLKQANLALIRKRIAAQGTTVRLEFDLAEQTEQIQDLLQLAEDWLNLSELIVQQAPSFSDLSEPIQWKLRSLGLQIDAPSTSNKALIRCHHTTLKPV
jgi:hypothetical protein